MGNVSKSIDLLKFMLTFSSISKDSNFQVPGDIYSPTIKNTLGVVPRFNFWATMPKAARQAQRSSGAPLAKFEVAARFQVVLFTLSKLQ